MANLQGRVAAAAAGGAARLLPLLGAAAAGGGVVGPPVAQPGAVNQPAIALLPNQNNDDADDYDTGDEGPDDPPPMRPAQPAGAQFPVPPRILQFATCPNDAHVVEEAERRLQQMVLASNIIPQLRADLQTSEVKLGRARAKIQDKTVQIRDLELQRMRQQEESNTKFNDLRTTFEGHQAAHQEAQRRWAAERDEYLARIATSERSREDAVNELTRLYDAINQGVNFYTAIIAARPQLQ